MRLSDLFRRNGIYFRDADRSLRAEKGDTLIVEGYLYGGGESARSPPAVKNPLRSDSYLP